MKITQDVRDYAATLNDPASVGMSVSGTIEDGMAAMSAKFKEMGGQRVSGCGEGEGEQSGVMRGIAGRGLGCADDPAPRPALNLAEW